MHFWAVTPAPDEPGGGCPPIVFATQAPTNVPVTVGGILLLSANVTGGWPLTYQWYQDGQPIAGGTSAQYFQVGAVPSDSGTYWVIASNTCNSGSGPAIAVTVISATGAPIITQQPANQTTLSNQTATLGLSATGAAPLSYQWYQGTSGVTGTPVTGSNATILITPPLTTAQSYWVQVTNTFGSANSETATITIAQQAANLTLLASPASGGSVTGGGTFAVGSFQQISATANGGWTFTGWNDGVTTSPRTVEVPTSGTGYTGDFSQTGQETATLTVVANPSNGGVVSGGGTFTVGSSQQISATANSGWTFTSWSDGTTTNPLTVVVPSGGASYTANFSQQTATLTVLANPSNGGAVSGGGTFAVGSSQQISATTNAGWTFADWSDGVAANPRTVTVPSGGATYTADFSQVSPQTATVTVAAAPVSGGSVTGSGTYTAGSSVTVSATPNGGYIFSNWTKSGIEVSSSGSYTFTLNGSQTLIANFVLSSTSGIVGQWIWTPNTQLVTINADGTTSSNFNITGVWTLTDPVNQIYQIVWNGGEYIDTLTLSADGNSSSGQNQYGNEGPFDRVNLSVLQSPTPDSTLPGSSVTFDWSTGMDLAQDAFIANRLTVGSSEGADDIFDTGASLLAAGSTSVTATGLPTDGEMIYVRLWTGTNFFNDYTYDAETTATLSVTAYPSDGGSVAGSGTFAVGSSQQISATANSSWTFAGWSDSVTTNPRTVTVPSGGATYTADFTPTYQVTPAAGPNGSISPDIPQTVTAGDSISFTAIPGAGYAVNQWLIGGSVAQTGGTSCTLNNVTADTTVQVTFMSNIGSLQVGIVPEGALLTGAQWQVDGGPPQGSGATVSGLIVGSHIVTFDGVGGYAAPSTQYVNVIASQTAMTTGTYTATGPFTPFPGSYRGLFSDDSGDISITLSGNGKFTGKMTIDGFSYSFKGKFPSTGIWQDPNVILQLGAAPIGAPGSHFITGSANGTVFAAWHAAYGKGKPVPELGVYKFQLTPPSGAGIPQELGDATLRITKTGDALLFGKLPGGTSFSSSAIVVGGPSGDQCLIYSILDYKYVTPRGARSFLIGAITFPSGVVTGPLLWIKPAQTKGKYPATIDTSLTISP